MDAYRHFLYRVPAVLLPTNLHGLAVGIGFNGRLKLGRDFDLRVGGFRTKLKVGISERLANSVDAHMKASVQKVLVANRTLSSGNDLSPSGIGIGREKLLGGKLVLGETVLWQGRTGGPIVRSKCLSRLVGVSSILGGLDNIVNVRAVQGSTIRNGGHIFVILVLVVGIRLVHGVVVIHVFFRSRCFARHAVVEQRACGHQDHQKDSKSCPVRRIGACHRDGERLGNECCRETEGME